MIGADERWALYGVRCGRMSTQSRPPARRVAAHDLRSRLPTGCSAAGRQTAETSNRDSSTLELKSKEEWVRELLIAMVPRWYVAKGGPNQYELGGLERAFHSVRPLTPKLRDLRQWMNSNFNRWVDELPQTPSLSSYAASASNSGASTTSSGNRARISRSLAVPRSRARRWLVLLLPSPRPKA